MMLHAVTLTLILSLVEAENNADVLVLGAGTAGIVAAKHLSDSNVSFLIIEGADMIGGRVKSARFGGKMVELGSPAIYGTNATIQAVVNMFNISGNYVDYENVIVRTSNGTIAATESEDAWSRLAVGQRKLKELYENIKDGRIPDMSVRIALQYGNWFPKTPVEDIIEIYDYDSEFAKVPELISTKGFADITPYENNPYLSTDPRGLNAVLEAYASAYLTTNDPRLRLNEVVDRISRAQSSVSVSTKSGKTFTGKYAIVTFSMGVLQSGTVAFEPALPEWKLDTIYKTSMDVFTVVYVKFPDGTVKFWDNHMFILHASPRRGYYPKILNMESEGFYPAGTNMLAFKVMGEEARRIERSAKESIKTEITGVLRNMYGSDIPEPEDILVTKWLDNPLVRGSFTSRQVGDNNPRFLDALTSPVGRIYFAGESYHKDLDGFAEGARLSAADTVRTLLACMKNRKCHQFNPNPSPPLPPKPVSCGADDQTYCLATLLCVLVACAKHVLVL